jgi:apolipoprotein N-acyltransferase
VAVAPLLLAVTDVSPVRAWWYGFLFGAVFRGATLYWVIQAMTQFGGLSLPVAVLGAALLVAYLAAYWGLFALVANRAGTERPETVPLLAATWTGLEYVQAVLMSGFPWALLGYAGAGYLPVAQVADLAGVYGLSFLVMLVNAAAAAVVRGRPGWRVPAVTALVAVAACVIYGYGRLVTGPTSGTGVSLPVALVQGNVAQDTKWDPSSRERTLSRHLSLSERGAQDGARLVVWPESSWPDPYGVGRDARASMLLAGVARRSGAALLVGTVHVEDSQAGYTIANAAVVVDGDGSAAGRYEKSHLVPFGEYLPLQGLLRFLGPLVQAVGSMRAGDPAQPLLAAPIAGVPPFGLAICYEIIFPSLVSRQVRSGAQFLITITNDAWYGTSSGPFQHFEMARLRAIENRRWLLRAANTGISGVVDPWGRVVERTEMETEALVMSAVKPRHELSPYVRSGDAFAIACLLLALACTVGAIWPRLGRFYGPA